MQIFEHSLASAVGVLDSVLPTADAAQSMDDTALLETTGVLANARRELDARAGWVAAEIARRSRRELGYSGLAQKNGFRTPEALVQNLTGSTRADAITLVKVGTMVADAAAADAHADLAGASLGSPGDSADSSASTESDASTSGVTDGSRPTPFTDTHSWRAGIARAVAAGQVSFAQAEAIRSGLGESGETVTGEVLADAATVLIDAATDPNAPLTVDELRKLARQMRSSVDADGLLAEEEAQQDAQYIKAWRRTDGMVGSSWLLDKENGAFLLSALDELTSPRRGGPRFVDPAEKRRAEEMMNDSRPPERIAVDGIMQLLRIGVNADTNTVFPTRKAAVRIVVTRDTLDGKDATDNRGIIENTGEPISVAAIERAICESGTVTVTVDSCGNPLDVGREQRLFTAKQRIALAVRDGGCIITGCDRPPSWTEAHHIDHWEEHSGLTNIDDGVLLCRHHHLALHNLGWRIIRRGHRYYLRTPGSGAGETLSELHSKNPLTRARLAREHSALQRAG